MTSQSSQSEVYTIGHSNLPAQTIVDLLQRHNIAVLVDVRSVPFSRFSPQFNQKRFAQTMSEAGIEYVYLGDKLGGRPKDATCYRTDGSLDYEQISQRPWYRQGIAELLAIAGKRRTSIMCSEEDPQRCHRTHIITRTLLESGVKVLHIRKDGRTQEEPVPMLS